LLGRNPRLLRLDATQAIPAIMCGRDVIGVAKTGSGKTLAFLLPLFRHILDQPPLQDGEGPVGLVMAPARELANQIYAEAKKFAKPMGLRVACVYGGAGVADQIADLKRGAEVVVCTPGRMIDILCMQAGKMVSLKRVTMVRHACPIALFPLPSFSPRPSPQGRLLHLLCPHLAPSPLVGPIPRSFWTRLTAASIWVLPRRST
jgi:DEAD/DEAH box helicase